MTDDEMTQRERRRQQFEKEKKKTGDWLTPERFKGLIIPAIVVLIIGGIVAGMVANQASADECPGHWHSAYTVYIDGDRVPFNPQAYPPWGDSDNAEAPGTHIHGDDGIYHWHPAVQRCTPWEDGLAHLDVDVSEDTLTLGSPHGARAGTYAEDGSNEVHLFEQRWSAQEDEWVEITDFSDVLGHQPGNGDGLVILYGDHTQEEIDALLAQATTMKGNPSYDPHYEG